MLEAEINNSKKRFRMYLKILHIHFFFIPLLLQFINHSRKIVLIHFVNGICQLKTGRVRAPCFLFTWYSYLFSRHVKFHICHRLDHFQQVTCRTVFLRGPAESQVPQRIVRIFHVTIIPTIQLAHDVLQPHIFKLELSPHPWHVQLRVLRLDFNLSIILFIFKGQSRFQDIGFLLITLVHHYLPLDQSCRYRLSSA